MNNELLNDLQKLINLKWVKTAPHEVIADNGCVLSIKTSFHPHHIKNKVQVILSLNKDGRRIWYWGSENNSQNDFLVDWFYDLYNKITSEEIIRDDENIKSLKKSIFE